MLHENAILDKLVIEANGYYEDLLGYVPEKTQVQTTDSQQWLELCQSQGLNGNSSGIFFPRNQTAIVPTEIETVPLSLFHEYFGHGLYCEQSQSGMRLVELEQKLLEEEKQHFEGKQFTLSEIHKFRDGNQTFQELDELRRQNLGTYEGFAVFTEFLLSGEFGFRDMFDGKYESQEGVDELISFNQQWGDLATFYGYGLRKVQDRKRLRRLSGDLFGDSLHRTKLITHFGSGKPFSDVDLFAVSNDLSPFYSDNWIDVRTYTPEIIEEKIRMLDPMVTDPIMVGGFVFGGEDYLEGLKHRVLAQPITEEAIRSSLQEYRTEMKRSEDESFGDHLREKIRRSAKTYLTNALASRNGDKVLTFNGLVDYSRTLSRSERFIELKGGIE